MPLPFILGAAAAGAAAAGVGTCIKGALKMKDANDTMKSADYRHGQNIKRYELALESSNKAMDKLGYLQLEVLSSFERFIEIMDKVQNKPEFIGYTREKVELPTYDKEALKEVSIGAGVLLGGAGGAALGAMGGFAAAGATTSAVMALGTASTGTAIASLSGAAATNATLAALGGGALAAGGGGMALGTAVLGAATAGVGLLVGGIIFNATGGKLSDKASEARLQMLEAEETIDKICPYLSDLEKLSAKYYSAIFKVKEKYEPTLEYMDDLVSLKGKTDWNNFTSREKLSLENLAMLVGLLYQMCKVNLVNKAEDDEGVPSLNESGVKENIIISQEVLLGI